MVLEVIVYNYKYKNEVGCRDDTVPKTGDTRTHCTVCNNLPQPPPYIIPTSYFIFNDFYIC